MSDSGSVRRALYVLFARLLAGPPDADLYARLRGGGLRDLARLQGVDLTSDLVDEEDAESSVAELEAEYAALESAVSLRASDYAAGAEDPVAALSAFLREHELALQANLNLPVDHLAVVLGIMGELAGREDGDGEARARARAFFLRHLLPWAPRALAELAGHADRRFYGGLAFMLAAFLGSEQRLFGDA